MAEYQVPGGVVRIYGTVDMDNFVAATKKFLSRVEAIRRAENAKVKEAGENE